MLLSLGRACPSQKSYAAFWDHRVIDHSVNSKVEKLNKNLKISRNVGAEKLQNYNTQSD